MVGELRSHMSTGCRQKKLTNKNLSSSIFLKKVFFKLIRIQTYKEIKFHACLNNAYLGLFLMTIHGHHGLIHNPLLDSISNVRDNCRKRE